MALSEFEMKKLVDELHDHQTSGALDELIYDVTDERFDEQFDKLTEEQVDALMAGSFQRLEITCVECGKKKAAWEIFDAAVIEDDERVWLRFCANCVASSVSEGDLSTYTPLIASADFICRAVRAFKRLEILDKQARVAVETKGRQKRLSRRQRRKSG